MYLNPTKFWITSLVSGAVTLYFGVMALLGLVILGGGAESWGFVIVVFWALIALISFLFFWDAVRAYRLSRIFMRSEDGLIDIEELARRLKMKHYRFVVTFHRLIGKRLLRNCSVFSEDPTCIILANEKYDIRTKFSVCQCRNCGASNTLRIGFEKECKYCGAEIL